MPAHQSRLRPQGEERQVASREQPGGLLGEPDSLHDALPQVGLRQEEHQSSLDVQERPLEQQQPVLEQARARWASLLLEKLERVRALQIWRGAQRAQQEQVRHWEQLELFLAQPEPPEDALWADARQADEPQAHEMRGRVLQEREPLGQRRWELRVSQEPQQVDAGRVV